MTTSKAIQYAFLVLPWFSLIFIKKENIRRYTPVVIITALIVTITHEIAYSQKWWILPDFITPWGNITGICYTYGAFLVGTLWIFHLTFKKFWLYALVNLVVDWLWAYPIIHFFESWNIFQYVNFREWNVWMLAFSQALVVYLFQMWFEKTFELRKTDKLT